MFLYLRSLIINLQFYLGTVLFSLVMSPLVLAKSARPVQRAIEAWIRFCVFTFRNLAGARIEYRGLENLPKDEGFILCSKHQSVLDAILLYNACPTLTAIGKQELKKVPFVGLLLDKIGVVWVERNKGTAHFGMNGVAEQILAEKRPLIIYPEGTRVHAGESRSLKAGVFHLQLSSEIKVIPVACNVGVFWPENKFWRRGGTVVMEFGKPLPHMDEREPFMALVEEHVVKRSAELMAAADIRGPNIYLEAINKKA